MFSGLDYATSGSLTDLTHVSPTFVDSVGTDPVQVCFPVHTLVIQPDEAQALHLPAERLAESEIRPAAALLHRLLMLDPAPVTVAREPDERVVGTCRHFAVLACALLRYRDIASRVRCGFATYFQPGLSLDHWITEYWDPTDARWVRVDAEILAGSVLEHPEDLQPEQFLSGGEAWYAYRNGHVDPSCFGVCGTENFGAAEIRGNAVKDLAALNKVEMLPWDEWGRMTEAYEGKTGSDYDDLLDQLAAVTASDDAEAIAALYDHEHFHVPAGLIR
jgi:hypothetical protein